MSNGGRIHSLDGFRAISVLLVLALHSTYTMRDSPLTPMAKQFLGYFGGLGVAVFFVMSGFLITTLLNREWEASGGLNLRGFYFKRACRILPPYVAYLVVMLLLAWGGWISVSWSKNCDGGGVSLESAGISSMVPGDRGGSRVLRACLEPLHRAAFLSRVAVDFEGIRA
jgi:peptidoglycan/LPS O-acetylase OafA/YrhL